MKRYFEAFRKEAAALIWLSLVPAFMLCVFAPMQYFTASTFEYWFDIYNMLPAMAGMLLTVFVLFFVLNSFVWLFCGLSEAKAFHWFLIFELTFNFYLYIQGNLLVKNLPLIDGTDVKWDQPIYDREIVISAAAIVLLVAFAIAVTLKVRLKRVMEAVVPVCICFILFMFLQIIIGSIPNFGKIYEDKRLPAVTDQNLMNYSSKKNFIVLLLDYTDTETFQERMDLKPENYDAFEDFTYYRNTQGLFPFTKFAILHILTGQAYENKGNYQDFFVKAMNASPLFESVQNNGYRIDMYEPGELIYYNDVDGYERFSNVVEDDPRILSQTGFIKHWIKYICFRYMPYGLKADFVPNLKEFDDVYETGGEYSLFHWLEPDFYKVLNTQEITYTDSPVFKFIHLQGAHAPFHLNENVEFYDGPDSYELNMDATIVMVKRYLERLKEADIYDNSAILIMADHGNSRNIGNDPVFMAKGFGTSEKVRDAFKISQAPIGYEDDLFTAYEGLMDGKRGSDLFKWQEGDSHDRRFLLYMSGGQTTRIYEHMLYGYVNDYDSFKPTGVVYDYYELN